jgi:hypothetical protein
LLRTARSSGGGWGEYPELALGDPFGVERQLLNAYGIPGRPEGLDPDDDKLSEWIAG